jgi:DNA-binding Lrp family transcriptional regulator
MLKLSEKERKILEELDLDSRQSDSKIAKKVGLSKQVVNYKIQKLIKQEIISNFYSVLNVGCLGYNSFYVFFQLQKITQDKENEFMNYLKNQPDLGWLVSCTGKWDFICLIYAKSQTDFSSLLNKILLKYDENILEYEFTTLLEAEHISYKSISKSINKPIKQTVKQENVSLTKIQINLLKAISQEARISIVNLSSNLKEKIYVVSYLLKKLIKKKVIVGFKPKLNLSLLGIQWYLLLIRFQPISEKRKNRFIQFCKSNKKIYYLTSTLGTYNLMLDIHVKDAREYKKVLFEIKEKFSDCVKFYETNIIFDEYKISYVPNLDQEKLPSKKPSTNALKETFLN